MVDGPGSCVVDCRWVASPCNAYKSLIPISFSQHASMMVKKRKKISIAAKSRDVQCPTVKKARPKTTVEKSTQKEYDGKSHIAHATGRSSLTKRRTDRKLLVPKSEILRQAAYAVGRLVEADATGRHGISLKSLTLGSNVKQKRAVYAVTIETLKYYTVLKDLASNVGVQDFPMSESTCCVLIKEIVLGSGLSRLGVGERMVLEKEKELNQCLKKMMEEKGVKDVAGLIPANKLAVAAKARRRTVRVNTISTSIENAREALLDAFEDVKDNLYIPEVLEMAPGVDLHSHKLVRNGSIVLQSFASCLPAFILDPEPRWNVIDACAAPGNKTTHLAAIMSSKAKKLGKVFAFDKDPKRLERLKANVSLTGSSHIIEPVCQDFLTVQSNKYDTVDAILLDPSCSGSGTSVSRMDYLLPSAQEIQTRGVMYTDERVKQLSQFQITALKHAMEFPKVKRIVYSTCSIYHDENEGVVAQVLGHAKSHGFVLVEALPAWPRRGIESKSEGLDIGLAKRVIRIDPVEDGTDGFFVAMFERQI